VGDHVLATTCWRLRRLATVWEPRGYTHVVETAGIGRTVYVAGQLGYDVSGKVPEPGDFRAQATQVFENLKAALASVDGGFARGQG
jgi:enamine deaminase RidA (YjgF/YER057c/UK114 family)